MSRIEGDPQSVLAYMGSAMPEDSGPAHRAVVHLASSDGEGLSKPRRLRSPETSAVYAEVVCDKKTTNDCRIQPLGVIVRTSGTRITDGLHKLQKIAHLHASQTDGACRNFSVIGRAGAQEGIELVSLIGDPTQAPANPLIPPLDV